MNKDRFSLTEDDQRVLEAAKFVTRTGASPTETPQRVCRLLDKIRSRIELEDASVQKWGRAFELTKRLMHEELTPEENESILSELQDLTR